MSSNIELAVQLKSEFVVINNGAIALDELNCLFISGDLGHLQRPVFIISSLIEPMLESVEGLQKLLNLESISTFKLKWLLDFINDRVLALDELQIYLSTCDLDNLQFPRYILKSLVSPMTSFVDELSTVLKPLIHDLESGGLIDLSLFAPANVSSSALVSSGVLK
jgi:hypothetical protein